jgi:uncharacterized membrane protein YeiH
VPIGGFGDLLAAFGFEGWTFVESRILKGPNWKLAFDAHLEFYHVPALRNIVTVFDAAGLGLFAVSGAQRALDHGILPVMAMLMGMITGTGGGIARDLLVARTPVVLRSELYAVAALLGAGVVVIGSGLGGPRAPVAVAGALLCMAIRLLAVRLHWNLPRSRSLPNDDRD